MEFNNKILSYFVILMSNFVFADDASNSLIISHVLTSSEYSNLVDDSQPKKRIFLNSYIEKNILERVFKVSPRLGDSVYVMDVNGNGLINVGDELIYGFQNELQVDPSVNKSQYEIVDSKIIGEKEIEVALDVENKQRIIIDSRLSSKIYEYFYQNYSPKTSSIIVYDIDNNNYLSQSDLIRLIESK
jgi:hypothetical protein